MQINLEIWVAVHLDESDEHPRAFCHKVVLVTVMPTNRQGDGGLGWGGGHPITLLHNTWILWVLEPKSSREHLRETQLT